MLLANGRAAAEAAAVALLGFLLPLTFVSKARSLGMYERPTEILLSYGTAWLLHLPLAAGLGTVAGLGGWLLARTGYARVLPAAIYVATFVFAVWLGGRSLIDTAMPRVAVMPVAAISSLVIGLAAGLSRPELAVSARTVTRALSFVGALLATAAIVAALSPIPARPTIPSADPRKPDILLITLDAFSNEHMSSMGYFRPTTPYLDRVARQGVQFSHLFAASNFTTSTTMSLLSGQYPSRHGAAQLKSRPFDAAMATSLPAQLQAGGYSLRAIVTNPAAGIYKNGLSRYFDVVWPDRLREWNGCADWLSRLLPYSCPASEIGIIDPLLFRLNAARSFLANWHGGFHLDAALALQSADTQFRRPPDGRPVFLWVHLYPPHDPYQAPVPFLGSFDASPRMRNASDSSPTYQFSVATPAERALYRARYDESLAAIDDSLGRFLTKLERAGRLDHTILMISADHGESFAPDYGGHAGPKLLQSLINIPLIVRGPDLARGLRVDQPVSQVDLAPTLLAAVGLAATPGSMDGRSLMPLLRGEALRSAPVFSMNLEQSSRFGPKMTGTVANINGRFKYVHYWGQPDRAGYRDLRDGLFDLVADPAESRNLAALYPKTSLGMRNALGRALVLAPSR